MANPTVTLRFLGDTRDIEKSFRLVQTETQQTQGKLSAFGAAVKPAMIAAGAAIATHFGRASVDAFKESEAAQSRLQQAFAKFSALSDTNIEALRRLNTELAKKTRFDDDATASGQAVLAQFGLTGKQLKQLTPLLQDYAARTGKDLPTAAQDLGKAILGQGRALKGIGLNFKDTGDKTANFTQLMDGLRQKVGGFAEKEGKTAAGQAAILGNQFGELQEKVGSVLVPALTKLADVLLTVVGFFQGLPGPVQAAIGVVAGLVVVVVAIHKAIQAWAVIQGVLNAVLAANPIVLIIAAIAALVAGVVIAYKNSETFRDIVQSVWEVLKGVASFIAGVAVAAFNALRGAVEAVVGFIQRNWPMLLAILTGPIGLAVKFIVEHFDSIVKFVRELPGKIGRAAAGMWDGIKDAFRSAINWIIRGWNRLEFRIPGFKVGPIGYDGFTLGVPDIPTLHSGGVFRAPHAGGEGLALLRDGEVVLPAGTRGGAPGRTVNVYMPPGSDGEDVVRAIREYEQRAGTSWRN